MAAVIKANLMSESPRRKRQEDLYSDEDLPQTQKRPKQVVQRPVILDVHGSKMIIL